MYIHIIVKGWLSRRTKSTRESLSQRDQNNTRLTEAEEVALVDEVRRRRKRRQASEIRRIASTQLDEQRRTWCETNTHPSVSHSLSG
jgi:hypothetical protein